MLLKLFLPHELTTRREWPSDSTKWRKQLHTTGTKYSLTRQSSESELDLLITHPNDF